MENERNIGNKPEVQTNSYAEHISQVSKEVAKMAASGVYPVEIKKHEVSSIADYLANNPRELHILMDNSRR